MLLTHVYDALLTLAYPQSCLVCGGSVERRSLGVACAACWESTRVFTGAETICWKCGALSPGEVPVSDREEVRCRRCDDQSFAVARAAGLYEKALRESVLMLKRQPHLSSRVCDLLVAAARRQPLSESTKVVPVPLHERRVRERGFNQASVIGEMLAQALRLPLDEVSLSRVAGSNKYRAGLDPRGRRETVAGAFAVRYPRLVEDENVLLVDDVFTTGATVSACAEALLAAKARKVFVLTMARAS